MDNEENKDASRRVSFPHPSQAADTDLALAILLQEQERAYTMLSTIQSDSDEEESDSSNENYDDADYEFFRSREIREELGFLEGEDSNSDQDMEEEEEDDDGIDPDELSYEELIALGEVIGEEKRGLSLSQISMCLHPYKSQSVDQCKNGVDRCVICQVEYEECEGLVALPCEHPYHSECISKWLQIKKICPICGTEVVLPKINC